MLRYTLVTCFLQSFAQYVRFPVYLSKYDKIKTNKCIPLFKKYILKTPSSHKKNTTAWPTNFSIILLKLEKMICSNEIDLFLIFKFIRWKSNDAPNWIILHWKLKTSSIHDTVFTSYLIPLMFWFSWIITSPEFNRERITTFFQKEKAAIS